MRWRAVGWSALVLVAIAATTPTAASSTEGGLKIVLTAVGRDDPERLDATSDAIRTRVELLRAHGSLAVDDASVTRRGRDIVVRLSGVKNPARAQRMIVPTPLYFRPVLARLPARSKPEIDDPAAKTTIASCDTAAIAALPVVPTTDRSEDQPNRCVVLPTRDEKARLLLGPAALMGNEDVVRARREFVSPSNYGVRVTLRKNGLSKFNALAAQSYGRQPPANEVAMVLDGVVEANPAFHEPRFEGNVLITGGYSVSEADDLARVINYGAFPVKLESVAPT